jgi:hypothetical protein
MERKRKEELENPNPHPQLEGLKNLESKDAKLGNPPSPKKLGNKK